MKKILVIGKKSFIGSNLSKNLSKYFKVDSFSFEEIYKKDNFFFKDYFCIINTTIHKKYVKTKYNKLLDLDRKFISKFGNIKFFYIFLNSRKIYMSKENQTERSRLKPLNNYSKNKLITENYLKKKIKNKLISLRISNIIGKRKYVKSRTAHKLFFDNFIKYKKKGKKIIVNNEYKDFLSIDQFCRVIKKVIDLEIHGIYNVSLSKKVYIYEITKWLDKNFHKKIEFVKSKKDSFTLSNKKLLKKIKIKLTKKQLEIFCKKLN